MKQKGSKSTHRWTRLFLRTIRLRGTISLPATAPSRGGVSLAAASRAARSLPAKSNGTVLPPRVTLAGLGGWKTGRWRGGVA